MDYYIYILKAIVDGKEICKRAKFALEKSKQRKNKKEISLLETDLNKVFFSFFIVLNLKNLGQILVFDGEIWI